MEHAAWGFPLSDFYPKTCAGPVRLVKGKAFTDARLWGTPVQFKYRWAVQKAVGALTSGMHTFTISSNITHVGLGIAENGQSEGVPRYNAEYGRWVAELQQEHIVAVKKAITMFPARPLRKTHSLAGVVHPLREWAQLPTTLPHALQANPADDDADADKEDDDDYSLSGYSDGSDSTGVGA
jgi:hypothetical protein